MRILLVDEARRRDGVITPGGAVEPSLDLDRLQESWRRGLPASGAGGLVEIGAAKLLAVSARGRRSWTLREALFEEWGARPVAAVVRRCELCLGLTAWLVAFDPRVPAYYVLRRGDLVPRAALVERGCCLEGPLMEAVSLSTGVKVRGVDDYIRACGVFDAAGPHPYVLLAFTVAALLGMEVEEAVGSVLGGRVEARVPVKSISRFTEHAWSFYAWKLMGEGWGKLNVHRFFEKLFL